MVEVLIAVVILAVLAALVVPHIFHQAEKAKEEKRKEQHNMKAKKSYGKKWEIVPELLIHHLPINFDRH